jgi:amidophosphoribosyltransferase
LAGIVAVSLKSEGKPSARNAVYYLVHAMRMLQHRGKAYWKIMAGGHSASAEGSLPHDDVVLRITHREKLGGTAGLGYLSKKSPPFPSMQSNQVAFDGFLVDTEKLHLHPYVGISRDSDSLAKVCHIFSQLVDRNAERAAEFLDRHLRGNLALKTDDTIYAYRDSTGFKPLVVASNKEKTLSIVASENSLSTSLLDLDFSDVRPGQLVRLARGMETEVLASASSPRLMMDPFEFIRESSVVATVNGKSIYQIRKNIGRQQAQSLDLQLGELDCAYAEPDYTRPMALGFGLQYRQSHPAFEITEGVIKDRYDDSDHMIDFSEEVSKNKLLSTKMSLKFVMQSSTRGKRVATIQGTIQTGSTTRETIQYLRRAGASRVDVIVSYVPTVDGRQVGLYTQNRELVANKYVGEVSSINELNENVSKEIGCDSVCYNSPAILAKGIGVPENNLWFPEWVRFLDYK